MRVYDQSNLPAFIETRASVLKCAKCFETHAQFIHIIFFIVSLFVVQLTAKNKIIQVHLNSHL